MKKLEFMNEVELRSLCNRVAAKVEEACMIEGVERPLFTVLLWNDPRVAQYVSNAQRPDVVQALRETVERFERQEDVTR